MEQTWKPTVAGILNIVSGGLSVIGFVFVAIGLIFFMAIDSTALSMPTGHMFPGLAFLFAIAIPLFIVDALAIVGGIYALRRKIWGWALTGAIAAIILSWPIGIASVVFTIMSKDEFK